MSEPAPRIVIPYSPRHWAKPFHASLKRFSALVLHRRAGKTTAVVNHHQRAALDDAWERRRLLYLRPELTTSEQDELIKPAGGRHYGHVMPLRNQAKLVAWDRLKYYAQPIPGVRFFENELLVRYPNGHKVQLFGADNPDALRGLSFSGISFDEYSQQPGNIFSEIISKALGDHLGYAIFCGTLKGRDQLYATWKAAHDSDAWFDLWQDVDASLATESGVTIQNLQEAMAADRAMITQGLMSQDEYDQEWFLSTDAAIKGQWYERELAAIRKDGRVCAVPYDPALPVDTTWDLGTNDATAIVFSQSTRAGEVRVIDYYENNNEGIAHYVQVLKERNYTYGDHWAPHDVRHRERFSGKSTLEMAAGLGLRFKVVPDLGVLDGINAVRAFLPRCWFDQRKTERLVECLRNYRKRKNTTLDEFTSEPVHDWASHGSDAMRYLAVRHRTPQEAAKPAQPYVPASVWG